MLVETTYYSLHGGHYRLAWLYTCTGLHTGRESTGFMLIDGNSHNIYQSMGDHSHRNFLPHAILECMHEMICVTHVKSTNNTAIVCQILSWWTKNTSHAISIWDIVTILCIFLLPTHPPPSFFSHFPLQKSPLWDISRSMSACMKLLKYWIKLI